MTPEELESFKELVGRTFDLGIRMKLRMLDKGLVRAQAKCPDCDGMLQGRLTGPRKHMRFWCSGTCGKQMME